MSIGLNQIIDGIKVVDFKHKRYLLNRMPVYIKVNLISMIKFLFLCEILLVVVVWRYGDLRHAEKFITYGIVFLAIVSSVLIYFLIIARKTGSFVMSADENGIYYRIFGEDGKFILLEWRIINRVCVSYDQEGATLLDVLTTVRNNDMPHPCNAVLSKTYKTKSVKVSFVLPSSMNGSEIKSELDKLRIDSHKAMLF